MARASFVAAAQVPAVIAILWLGACAARPPGVVQGAVDRHDWSLVMTLAVGSTIRVEDSTPSSVAGHLVLANADGVTISSKPSRTVSRSDVRRLFLIERLTATKATRGWVVGTVAGTLMGAFGARSNRLPWTLFLGAGWGAVGAGIGASDGFFDRKESLVYQGRLATQANPTKSLANTRMQPTRRVMLGGARLIRHRWADKRKDPERRRIRS